MKIRRLTGLGLRRLWFLTVWRIAILAWCRRFVIEGRSRIPGGPVVVVANHASHADTVVLQYALALSHRRPIRVAGAEDYWFRSGVTGLLARALGVFPFPRRGDVGVERAREVLAHRMSVLLFPQGTRAGGRFRAGIGRIAVASGVEVVPVHVAGTEAILPKGSRWPQRGDVLLRIGEPVAIEEAETPEQFAARLERIIHEDLGRAA